MPYPITRYHCNICRTPYAKHADAEKCERINHIARTEVGLRRGMRPRKADGPKGHAPQENDATRSEGITK